MSVVIAFSILICVKRKGETFICFFWLYCRKFCYEFKFIGYSWLQWKEEGTHDWNPIILEVFFIFYCRINWEKTRISGKSNLRSYIFHIRFWIQFLSPFLSISLGLSHQPSILHKARVPHKTRIRRGEVADISYPYPSRKRAGDMRAIELNLFIHSLISLVYLLLARKIKIFYRLNMKMIIIFSLY